ncbi:MAG: hypothetical protein WC861_03955 [Candidatus Micrarchaeia archaeon]|jgi:hypothetical protein
MHSDALQRKVREAASKAKEAPANFSKEHIVVTYSFNGRQGQRVLRCEGTDAFGSTLYYDYRTNAVKSLEAHARSWGVTNLKETHKADLANLKATRIDATSQQEEGRTQAPQQPQNNADTSHRPPRQAPPQPGQTPQQSQNTADTAHRQAPGNGNQGVPPTQNQPVQPGQNQHQQQPGNGGQGQPPTQNQPAQRPRQRRPARQKPVDGKLSPKAAEPKAPFEPPQGRPAGTAKTDAFTELSRPMPIFDYFKRYYSGTVHCASFAWGISMSYLCAEQGRSAVIFPVSSWKLKDYLTNRKNKEITALVKQLDIPVRTNKDYYDILANTQGRLQPGAVMTLDSGHAWEGKLKNQPTHTMVYLGYGYWADNRDDKQVIKVKYSEAVARSGDAAAFSAQAAKETKNAVIVSPSDLLALKNNGDWLRKGNHVLAREGGEYFLYKCSDDDLTSFKRLASVPASSGAAGVANVINNPWVDMASADAKKIGSLKEGECAFLSPQINNQYIFSSLDGGVARSIRMFGKDVFTGFQGNGPTPVQGLDGKDYWVKREFTASGLPEICVYSPSTDVVYYIVQKNGANLGISVKKHWFLDRFEWSGGSGVYQVDIDKMPPAKKRAISSQDFGLQSVTAEGFAALLSKTYSIQFEYALNEIMRQNPAIPYPRAKVRSISVVLAVILPDVKIGRITGPIERLETPAERRLVHEIRDQKPNYTPRDKEEVNIRSAVILRGDAYLKRCSDIDSKYYKLGIMASNVGALQVILYNELFSSPKSLDEKYREQGFFSDREAGKSRARELFGIDGNAIGDAVAKIRGKNDSRLDSWGPFQTNIDYVRYYLEGYHMRKVAGGKEKYLPDDALGAKRREEIGALLASAGASKETLFTLRKYAALPQNKRELVADMLYDFTFALYFANKLLSENKSVIEDQAKKIAGRKYWGADLEMTSVLAYNRGIVRANTAIFQQNLLLVGQTVAGQAMASKDQGARDTARELYSTLKKLQIDGLLSGGIPTTMGSLRSTMDLFHPGTSDYGGKESNTFKAFKLICALKGIGYFRLGTKTYDAQKMGLDEFAQAFGTNGNYKRAFEFFELPQFAEGDFASKTDKGNKHPYPALNYAFLSSVSESNKKALTSYLASYMFYIKPVEEEPHGPTYSSATLKLDRYDWATGRESNKINIAYTVPYSPGLGTMSVYNIKGEKVATIFENARQNEGKYRRASPALPPGVYAVKYTVGTLSVASTITILPSSGAASAQGAPIVSPTTAKKAPPKK